MAQNKKGANPMETAICEAVIIPCLSGRSLEESSIWNWKSDKCCSLKYCSGFSWQLFVLGVPGLGHGFVVLVNCLWGSGTG